MSTFFLVFLTLSYTCEWYLHTEEYNPAVREYPVYVQHPTNDYLDSIDGLDLAFPSQYLDVLVFEISIASTTENLTGAMT